MSADKFNVFISYPKFLPGVSASDPLSIFKCYFSWKKMLGGLNEFKKIHMVTRKRSSPLGHCTAVMIRAIYLICQVFFFFYSFGCLKLRVPLISGRNISRSLFWLKKIHFSSYNVLKLLAIFTQPDTLDYETFHICMEYFSHAHLEKSLRTMFGKGKGKACSRLLHYLWSQVAAEQCSLIVWEATQLEACQRPAANRDVLWR